MGLCLSRKEGPLYQEYKACLPPMQGKVVAITGCTSGTGLVLARTLAQAGAEVIMLNRSSKRADDALKDVQALTSQVTFIECDLMSFASVRKAATELNQRLASKGLDVLCNNAGVSTQPDQATVDGYDPQMQTNHLSHFLLTQKVWPLLLKAADLRGESRVVNHSSGYRHAHKQPFHIKYYGKNGGQLGGDDESFMETITVHPPGLERYCHSKLANLIFTYALDDRIRQKGLKVKALCANPGFTATRLIANSERLSSWSDFMARLAQSEEDGTLGILRCSCDPSAQSGDFFSPPGGALATPAGRELGGMAEQEMQERHGLLASEPRQSEPVLGGALVSWNTFWVVVFPLLVAGVVVPWLLGHRIISEVVVGLIVLYLMIEGIILVCFPRAFQLWALQRPWNFLVRLLLPPIEILDSIGAGGTDLSMFTYRQWGENLCASGQVWLGSHAVVSKALTSPQARNNWLGEHPLYRGALPEGDTGRCVFLLSLSGKAAGGTGDHEAFRKCMIDTLFNDASMRRETDELSQSYLEQAAEDFVKMTAYNFYHASDGGNTTFWIKYLHHVIFGMDVRNPQEVTSLYSFLFGSMALTHYLEPFGRLPCISQHKTIDEVADLYEKSPAFANFKVKPEYNNMTARELAVLMTAIMRIAGIQGSRMLMWLCTSGDKHGNLQTDIRPIWDSLNLDDDDELERFVLEVSRLSPPVTISHRIAQEDFSCEIKGKSYNFPKGTNVAIPIVYANIDEAAWGPDVWEFNHNRPGLKEKQVSFNSVNGVGDRECPGKGLVLRSMIRLLRVIGKKRRQQSAAQNV
ncbi:RDH12 [Symbiodinium sp. CCMP2456]|nr:RDH12 [Symbiodinium sp. CCMP2456]